MDKEDNVVDSLEATQELAREFTKKLVAGDIVLLMGNLGAGKTTFTQALAEALGVGEKVTSPTFTIIGEYHVPGHESISRLVHIDLYRLDDEAAVMKDEAIREALAEARQPGRVTLIEWGDRLNPAGFGKYWQVDFQHGETPRQRVIVINQKMG